MPHRQTIQDYKYSCTGTLLAMQIVWEIWQAVPCMPRRTRAMQPGPPAKRTDTLHDVVMSYTHAYNVYMHYRLHLKLCCRIKLTSSSLLAARQHARASRAALWNAGNVSFWFLSFSLRRPISEVAWPIVAKLCHMFDGDAGLQMYEFLSVQCIGQNINQFRRYPMSRGPIYKES